jgi:hypothetical protein
LDARATVLRLVEDDFRIGQGVGHQRVFRDSVFSKQQEGMFEWASGGGIYLKDEGRSEKEEKF